MRLALGIAPERPCNQRGREGGRDLRKEGRREGVKFNAAVCSPRGRHMEEGKEGGRDEGREGGRILAIDSLQEGEGTGRKDRGREGEGGRKRGREGPACRPLSYLLRVTLARAPFSPFPPPPPLPPPLRRQCWSPPLCPVDPACLHRQ